MSRITKEINRITGTIIRISGKMILYALIVLLLAEGVTRGYAFGHSLFENTAVESAPGRDMVITVEEGRKPSQVVSDLKDLGLIESGFAAEFQIWFYDYAIRPGTYTLNTSMTSREMLQIMNEGNQEKKEKES